MNTRSQSKRMYSWIGKVIRSDEQLQISYYRGISFKSEKKDTKISIFPGEFVLIEGEDTNRLSVARLQKFYEDGAQEKHAVVQWFTHSEEIPLKNRLSWGVVASQQIFFNENSERDTDINVTSIISNATVIPLSLDEALPKDKQMFFVRESWNGKSFKPLPPSLLAELKDSVKMKRSDTNIAADYHLTPSSTACLLRVETEKVTRSTGKSKNRADIESKHSTFKSSLAKERHFQRIANGINTSGAKKKLQLNTPTKSPRTRFTEQDVIALLDNDIIKPLEQTNFKRKVTFTGTEGSPSKIFCAPDEDDLFLDIKPLVDEKMSALSPCKRNQHSSLKSRSSGVNRNTTDSSSGADKWDKIDKTPKKSKDSKKQAATPKSNCKDQKSSAKEPESEARTPRSRRKCAQMTASRIAKQLGILDTAGEEDDGKDFLYSMGSSDSSSSDEEDSTLLCKPKRRTKATPKTLRKPSAETPAKDSSKNPELKTPKTPHNATPRIRNRNQTARKPANVLEEARIRLHVSAVPESLPCREKEFQDIYNFIESKLIDGTGGCMYISGVPGTGKTATVHEVIRCLQKAAENNELPSFQFIEINGMKLTDPHQAYVQILKLLTGQKATATHAAVLLEKMFCMPGSKRKTVLLMVDELDLLWTRKQNVMYNLFDWPTQKNAKLIVLAIANTMDLPERMMMNRVASRLGLTRMSFQPYTYKQLQQIISSRMGQMKAFEEDAIQLVSRKVAALSGDARRCLDICRRSTEICELPSQKNNSGLVSMAHIMEAMDEMFSSPYINTIRNASLQEQIFLKAIIAEFHRSGLEEATVQQVFHQHVALCRMEGLQTPTVSEIMSVSSRLNACRLLLVESSNKYLHMRVRLNVSQDDVMYALKEE
ncbi:origin recognition complex subunit 1 [Hemicordylus capensis]|uniref:origin recognition complex subunit 1 n=1 Tax=Hemicordylus capensis TaxID=884348 RepID=UPI002303EE51|nr:origin recognition complex subunit 1 [Hemicordylus capensis]